MNAIGCVGVQVQLDPDLVQLERGQQASGDCATALVKDLCGCFKTEAAVGGDGQGVPQVVVVIPAVIVRHTGMLIDDGGGGGQVMFGDFGGDEGGLISERSAIENRADLADDGAGDGLQGHEPMA